jgi:hypothetical protein
MARETLTMMYILGNGSTHYNEELRFSLRTVADFCPQIKRLILVGENPNFLSEKVEYHKVDEVKGNKEYRIAMKIINGIKASNLKGDFVFMNDDFFFLKPQNFTNYPNYCKGNLFRDNQKIEHYQKALQDTHDYLKSIGKTTHHFDIHYPIIYNAQKFLKLMPHFEQSRLTTNGMVVKSLYGNIYGLEPTMAYDCKLNSLQTYRDYERMNRGDLLSCSDAGWAYGVRIYLKKMYPNKCKYEK